MRPRPRPSLSERFVRFWNRCLLFIYTGFAIVYLMLPVAVMIVFSFNDPAGRVNLVWQGFTLDAWLNPFDVAGLPDAVTISLVIAFALDDRRDDPRDAHRAGPGAPPVPRPGRHQPVHLPADGDARDRPRRLAPDPVRRDRRAAVLPAQRA